MSERTASVKPCEVPGSASVEAGLVVLDGPDGVAVTMTAEAANLTAASLQAAAAQVLGPLAQTPVPVAAAAES
ncbi:MAG: hypothetical protein EOO28_04500 [Comamonadaceae bacterium]|nr:MAG: hypothetical protein EOO28_04500 [Comamonadaceae bacterium]